jgi:hypothetical protein
MWRIVAAQTDLLEEGLDSNTGTALPFSGAISLQAASMPELLGTTILTC